MLRRGCEEDDNWSTALQALQIWALGLRVTAVGEVPGNQGCIAFLKTDNEWVDVGNINAFKIIPRKVTGARSSIMDITAGTDISRIPHFCLFSESEFLSPTSGAFGDLIWDPGLACTSENGLVKGCVRSESSMIGIHYWRLQLSRFPVLLPNLRDWHVKRDQATVFEFYFFAVAALISARNTRKIVHWSHIAPYHSSIALL
ncbi:hypothetical protein WN944_006470 [Citrus x changshan-huyou]|uniref:Uncharacterized protein n=1 Tax=Citrus x changshan-huyou TaxID=2935761 RepID=A0AAP0MLR0_9ROSI